MSAERDEGQARRAPSATRADRDEGGARRGRRATRAECDEGGARRGGSATRAERDEGGARRGRSAMRAERDEGQARRAPSATRAERDEGGARRGRSATQHAAVVVRVTGPGRWEPVHAAWVAARPGAGAACGIFRQMWVPVADSSSIAHCRRLCHTAVRLCSVTGAAECAHRPHVSTLRRPPAQGAWGGWGWGVGVVVVGKPGSRF